MKKIILVTGGGSGIGRAAALTLLENGFEVIIAGRKNNKLEETIALAKPELASHMHSFTVDVTNPESVDKLFSIIKSKFGRLDVLFNNAGTNVKAARIDDTSFEDWKKVIDVNLTGAFLCAQGAFRMMMSQNPQGGRIINNGSISSQVPRPGAVPYNASKNAINGLTKSISLDGRPYNIACGQIDIGNAMSDMSSKMSSGVTQADGSTKTEPLIDVSHIGEAVLHMAQLPTDVNILNMTIMANGMPFVGRG